MSATREELGRTLAASADSLLLCDSDGRIVDANDPACALTGYDRQDLLSRHIEDLTGTQGLISGLRENATLDLEAGLRRKDGSTTRLQFRLRSVRVGDHAHSVVRVTHRRRAADRLPEEPEFIRALLQSAGMLVVCVCPRETVVFANPAFESLVGLGFRAFRGRRIWDLVPSLRAVIEATDESGKINCVWSTADAAPKEIAWTGTRLTPGQAGVPYLLLVGREISPVETAASRPPIGRRGLEERFAQLTRELEKERREHEALTYTLAHDFRAPLRAMSGLSDALIEDCAGAGDDGVACARRIARAARQMDALIENLLLYNRISRTPVSPSPQSLENVLAEVLQALEDDLRHRKAEVTVDVGALHVLADRKLLFLVIFQLLSNALKFVLPEVAPNVALRAERRDPHVRLTVRDNGIGIPARYHGLIFGLGERLNPAEAYQGTGMGLAIVGRALERMQGRIGLESQVGKGSCFWVDLAAAPGPGSPPSASL